MCQGTGCSSKSAPHGAKSAKSAKSAKMVDFAAGSFLKRGKTWKGAEAEKEERTEGGGRRAAFAYVWVRRATLAGHGNEKVEMGMKREDWVEFNHKEQRSQREDSSLEDRVESYLRLTEGGGSGDGKKLNLSSTLSILKSPK